MTLPRKVSKEFDLELDGAYYEKSPNPDMIYKWERSEVYLRGVDKSLERQLDKINRAISAIGEPVSYPKDVTPRQKVAIDFFNAQIQDKAPLELARDEMQEQLDKLGAV